MLDNISWLDVLSFIVSVVGLAITYRLDRRQTRYLENIERKEEEIRRKMSGGAHAIQESRTQQI